MADEQGDPEEASSALSCSSSHSKRNEEPVSLPGGRSSAAERRVGARRALTPAEQEALVRELEASCCDVREFAAAHGVHPTTLYTWRRRVRAGEPVHGGGWKKARPNFSAEERRAALEAWSKSGMCGKAFAKLWGVSAESLRHWRTRYELGGPQALEPQKTGRPRGKGRSALPVELQEEILRTKRRF